MEVTNDLLFDAKIFSEELRLLRAYKGKYITHYICLKLENLANEIAEIVRQQNCNQSIKPNDAQRPEKVSDKMVDLCLECIEIYLQKITNPTRLSPNQAKDKIDIDADISALQILVHISCDLKTLAKYIKFTIYSDKIVLAKSLNNHKPDTIN